MKPVHWIAITSVLTAGIIVTTALIKNIDGLVYSGGLAIILSISTFFFGMGIKKKG